MHPWRDLISLKSFFFQANLYNLSLRHDEPHILVLSKTGKTVKVNILLPKDIFYIIEFTLQFLVSLKFLFLSKLISLDTRLITGYFPELLLDVQKQRNVLGIVNDADVG